MKKIVLTFGLIGGAILSALLVISFTFWDAIGFDRSTIVLYTSMVLAFLLVYFGVRSYRDNVAGGTISFWRALGVGALIAFVTSACYVATWQVIYHTAAQDFGEKYSAHVLGKARASGASEADLARQKAELDEWAEMYRKPVYNVAMTFLEPLPVALIVTLVSAGVLSRGRRSDLVVADGVATGARASG